MADRLKTLQEQKKDLEAQTKALGAEIAELDEQLSDAMTEAELDRFSRNGSTFYLKSRLFASPASGRVWYWNGCAPCPRSAAIMSTGTG